MDGGSGQQMDVLHFDAGNLLNLSLFSGFTASVQAAIKDLRLEVAAVPALAAEVAHLRASLAAATAALDHRAAVDRLRHGHRRTAAHVLESASAQARRRFCFHAWLRHAARRRPRRSGAVARAERGAWLAALARGYAKLAAFRCRGRALRALAWHGARDKLRRGFAVLRAHARGRRAQRAARHASVVARVDERAGRCLLARGYAALAAFERVRRRLRSRQQAVHALRVRSGTALCRRHYEMWARWARLVEGWKRRMRQRGERLRGLLPRTQRAVLEAPFRRMRRYAELRGRARERDDIIARLAELTLRSDANATESLLDLKLEVDGRVGELLGKCELIGGQVDVSLASLSNTNSVLNKMVDRLLAVDEHLDVLHREKVSRVELEACGAAPVPAPVPLPIASHLRHTPTAAAAAAAGAAAAASAAAHLRGSRTGTPPPEPQPRHVSPVRQRGEEGGVLAKQRTTFSGYSGVINASLAAETPTGAPVGSAIGQGVGTQELDSILRRLETRQRALGPMGGGGGGGAAAAGAAAAGAAHARETDALRMRELEKKLGLPAQYVR